MSKRGSYAVRISGLGEGNHDFSFELDQQFFASFEHPEIENGRVLAQIILEKKSGVLALHFSLNGEVEVLCDRCLESFMTKISSSQVIFVKTGESHGEIEDDVVVIGKDDNEIEVGRFMFEFIILALPFKRIHPVGTEDNSCNPDMLERLNAHRSKESDQNDQTDPRWDALKSIIEKNN